MSEEITTSWEHVSNFSSTTVSTPEDATEVRNAKIRWRGVEEGDDWNENINRPHMGDVCHDSDPGITQKASIPSKPDGSEFSYHRISVWPTYG